MFGRILTLVAFSLIIGSVAQSPAESREQWQMTHPPGSPPSQPIGMAMGSPVPGQTYGQAMTINKANMANPEFWKNQGIFDRVPVGTVLSGVLDDDLSSAKNKVGDIFSITLNEGYYANERQVLPKGARIVGKVLQATPASTYNHGNPGRLQISLHSLVLPNGVNLPFFGFIARNHNIEKQSQQSTDSQGYGVTDVPGSFVGWMKSIPRGVGGYAIAKGRFTRAQNQGNNYVIEKGEVVPVRINRTLVIPEAVSTAQPIDYQQGQAYSPVGNNYQNPSYGKKVYTNSNVPGLMRQVPNVMPMEPPARPLNITPPNLSDMQDPF